MSLDYARQIVKISLSLICDRLGFDRTSETSIDILVDVCEREFHRLFNSIHRIVETNGQTTLTLAHLTNILFDESSSNSLRSYSNFVDLFADLHFPKDLSDLPRPKSNPVNLRIPPSNCEQILRRDENSSTEYIYSWLPLYPDEENNASQTNHTSENDVHAENERTQKENIVKVDLHHAANLSCLTNSKFDSNGVVLPTGTKPSRSLPKVVYRPKRLLELEMSVSDKSKKDQQEKENTEKDNPSSSHQTTVPPSTPLRLTIPKANLNGDKSSSSNKKNSLLGSTLSSNFNSNSSSTITSSISPKETVASSSTNPTIETTPNKPLTLNDGPSTTTITSLPSNSSVQPSNNLTDPITSTRPESSTFSAELDSLIQPTNPVINKKSISVSSSKVTEKPSTVNIFVIGESSLSTNVLSLKNSTSQQSTVEQSLSSNNVVLDLSKKSSTTENKIPSLKLNLKKFQAGSTSSTTTAVRRFSSLDRIEPKDDKSARLSSTSQLNSLPPQKFNIKIPGSLFPPNKLDEPKERDALISPTFNRTGSDRPLEQNQQSNSKQDRTLKTSIDLKSMQVGSSNIQDKSTLNLSILQKINFDRLANPANEKDNNGNQQKSKKKAKKQKSAAECPLSPVEKKFKKESEVEQEKVVTIDSTPTSTVQSVESVDQNLSANKRTDNQEKVATGIRLKIKLNKPTSLTENHSQINDSANSKVEKEEKKSSVEPKPDPIRVTLPLTNSSSSRRKSSHVKKFVREKSNVEQSIAFDDDLQNSIDDLPLLERTSPSKQMLGNGNPTPQPTEEKTSTDKSPAKKKNVGAAKKKTNKSLVDVAVIDEKRIDHELHGKIWICPSCNRPDNGKEAMIACDLCDDWYHWECVGIVEEPAENISWFCPKCHRSHPSTNPTQTGKSSSSNKAKRKKVTPIIQNKQLEPQQSS